jgi:hypothetical protein
VSSSVISHCNIHHWPNFNLAQPLDPNVHNAQLCQYTFQQTSLAKFQPCPVVRWYNTLCTALTIHISTSIFGQISNLPSYVMQQFFVHWSANAHFNTFISGQISTLPSWYFQHFTVSSSVITHFNSHHWPNFKLAQLFDATIICEMVCQYKFQQPALAKFQPCLVVRSNCSQCTALTINISTAIIGQIWTLPST